MLCLRILDALFYFVSKCIPQVIILYLPKIGSVRKAGCNPCYNRVKTLSLPHEAMASITNRIP